jgi:type II secretory pathway pseudopilin PulG
MKRNVVCMTLMVIPLVLAACGSASTTPTTAGTANATTSAGGAGPMQGELTPVAKEMLGTFKLEGTDQAVDKAQAATLLPLWQAYRSLVRSDTAAAQEIDAVKTQIDEAMTAKQKDAIAAMNLTPQDMFATAQQLGVVGGTGSANGNGNSTGSSSERPFVFNFNGGGQGQAGGGAPPSGGGNRPSGGGFVIQGGGPSFESGGFDPSTMARGTPQPGQTSRARQGDRFSMMLLDPLINLLKERAGS